jgi:hypothetical protein
LAAGFAVKITTRDPGIRQVKFLKNLVLLPANDIKFEQILWLFLDKTVLVCCLTAAKSRTLGFT